VIDSLFSCVQQKKINEVWSTNHGDLEVWSYPQNWLFWKPYFDP